MPSRSPRIRALAILMAASVLAVIGLAVVDGVRGNGRQAGQHAAVEPPSPGRPNIVFVLTDDLDRKLVAHMPHVLAMQRAGMTFTNYTVTDSLCCPSRASILTGDFPHNTHVISNDAPSGGAYRFRHDGTDRNTFATSAAAAGYRTALIGKYLNGYHASAPIGHFSSLTGGSYVPPGWSSWSGVDGGGYKGYDYTIADDHGASTYGSRPADYLTGILQQRATSFVDDAAAANAPFLLEVATFAPHRPFVPAPRDVGTFTARAPRSPSFGRAPTPAPAWLRDVPPLNARATAEIDRTFDLRVEAVQSVDRMVAAIQDRLAANGQAANTVFVFSSDNGFHLGDYTLRSGKQTAFDTDVRVPLIVTGPGIAAGSTDADVVENIDLRPTFDALIGQTTPAAVDGHSFLPLLHGDRVPWRTVAGIEHHRADPSTNDPDSQGKYMGVPPTYTAIRTAGYTYVRYRSGDREYYDNARDPFQLRNLGPTLPPARVAALDATMNRLLTCHGAVECWTAGRPIAP